MFTPRPKDLKHLAALFCWFWLSSCEPEPARPPTPAAEVPPSGPQTVPRATEPASAGSPRGSLVIDGSSTVFPITEAVADEFAKLHPGVAVQLGVSGTGGGFRKFCAGETQIQNASRPIKAKEAKACKAAGIDFIELPVAFDGLTFVVHPSNSWAGCLSVDDLRRLWEPAAEGRISSWSHLRRDWPDRRFQLYGAGRDSGTFDYMTSALTGEEGSARRDFIGSEDDYLLAQNVAADPNGLGFFGFAYYREYQDRLRPVAIDAGAGCVAPNEENIVSGAYRPLSRPIFIYVALSALEREEARLFTGLYLDAAPRLVPAVKYVPLPARVYALAKERLERRVLGSLFDDGSQVGVSIEALLEMESTSLAKRP